MPPTTPTAPTTGHWLTRNLAVLSAVSFFQDAASELLYPILPIFLTATLGAPVAVVGAVEGVAEGVASVTKALAGGLSDRVSRRPLIGAGYGLAAFAKLLIAVATGWPLVLLARCVDRLGKGIRGAPRDALLVVDIPAEVRGRAFGLHRAADTLGAVVGPLLGLAGYELFHHRLRPLLVIAVVPAVASVALVAIVREAARAPARPAHRGPAAAGGVQRPGRLLAARELPRPFWQVAGLLTVFALVNFPDALLLLRLRALGFSVASVILAYVGYNAVYAALSYPAGALSDRLPRSRVFGVGLICFAVGYIGLGVVHSRPLAWLLLAVYGGFTAATDGVGKAWISGLVTGSRQGSAQGVFGGLSGLGILVAGLWAGFAWGGTGRIPLMVSGVVAAVLAVVLLAGYPRRPPP